MFSLQKEIRVFNKKYKKVKKLGQGSFGYVYQVVSLEDDKFYTMKKFYKGDVSN